MARRRAFIKTAGTAATASLAGCLGGGNGNEDGYTLTSASILPEGHPLDEADAVFRETVTNRTDGEVQWDHFPAGQLSGDPSEYVNLIQEGSADYANLPTAYVEADSPLSTAADLPGTYTEVDVGNYAAWHYGNDFLQEQEWDDLGIEIVGASKTGPYQLITAGTQVTEMEDFDGLTIRSSGTVAIAVDLLGGASTTMAADEVYDALQRGTIDGTVNGLYTISSYDWDQVADYATLNVNLGSGGTFLGIDQETYDGFSTDIQNAFGEARAEALAASTENISSLDNEVVESGGIEFYEIDSSEIERWNSQIQPAIDEWIEGREDKGHAGQEAFDAWKAAIEKAESELD